MNRLDVLNVVGCGKAGRTLARLLVDNAAFSIGDILNRTVASTQAAVDFIGAGAVAVDMASMSPAHAWLISTSDDTIRPAADRLAASGLLRGGDLVFHLSGATSSAALAACAAQGARVASVHPVKNFSDPAASVQSFPGTWCGCEGDPEALARLKPVFAALGARLFDIDARYKAIYHGGGAFACNFLPVLMEIALRCEEKAGIPREVALAMFEPIARETLEAVFRQGIAPAVAGPIARGDAGTVAGHLDAMNAWSPEVASLYARLGAVATDLVESLGRVDVARIAATRAVLAEPNQHVAGGPASKEP